MLASAGRRVKRPVKVGKSPPTPLFKGGGFVSLPPFPKRGRLDSQPPSSKEGARIAVPFFKGGLDLPARCFKGAARVPRSASSQRVAVSP
jgi:hypothetical protein